MSDVASPPSQTLSSPGNRYDNADCADRINCTNSTDRFIHNKYRQKYRKAGQKTSWEEKVKFLPTTTSTSTYLYFYERYVT